jgi:uncharacterized membrane protein
MISNGVGSFVNFIPVILGVVLLGAALGGQFLSAAMRKQVEKYALRPLFILVLAAGLYWAGHEAWRDATVKHDNVLVALHLGLAAVLIWLLAETVRRTIRLFRDPPQVPPLSPPHEGAK